MRVRKQPPIVCLFSMVSFVGLALAVANCSNDSSEPNKAGAGGSAGQTSQGGGGKGGAGGVVGSGGSTKGSGGSAAGGGSGTSSGTGEGGGTTVATGGTAGSATGGATGAGGATVVPVDGGLGPDATDDDADSTGGTDATDAGGGNYPWPNCKPIFDGKTWEGWGGTANWKIENGAMAATGKGAQNYTLKKYKEFRWIFTLIHKPKQEHNPSVIFWGRSTARGLAGIQFQSPTCGGWDYRPGQDKGIQVQCPAGLPIDSSKWTQCEILASATGIVRQACCQQDETGDVPCKAKENAIYNNKDAVYEGPIGFMIHNDGIFDQFKNICVEENPTNPDVLITTQ